MAAVGLEVPALTPPMEWSAPVDLIGPIQPAEPGTPFGAAPAWPRNDEQPVRQAAIDRDTGPDASNTPTPPATGTKQTRPLSVAHAVTGEPQQQPVADDGRWR